jgi:toluene monooxygenase system ferredoxin subunit
MMRVRVCAVVDVPPGETRGFQVPGLAIPVMVTNEGGILYAASSQCPHEEVSLLDGTRSGLTITCRGHGYEFDLASGRCAHDPALRLPCYRTHIHDGALWIDLL